MGPNWNLAPDSLKNWSKSINSICIHSVIIYYDLNDFCNRFDSVGIHATDKKCPILKHYESKSQILVQVLFAASNGDRLALER